jgi:G:T/U-mismatch repair DNA glycosylase
MSIELHPFISGRWKRNNVGHSDENWFLGKNQFDEVESFAYMPRKECNSIFLGTFPIWEIVTGKVSERNQEFFYGSGVNDFWPCLSDISSFKFDCFSDRVKILSSLNTGITDVLLSITRDSYNSSEDLSLNHIKYNDILSLKKSYPELKNIFLTSGGRGPIPKLASKTKSAASWFRDSLSDSRPKGFSKNSFIKRISVEGVVFNLIYLYSPSDSANIPIQGILNRNNNFGIENLNIKKFRKLQWSYFLCKYSNNENPEDIISIRKNQKIVEDNKLLFDFFNGN